MSFRSPSFLIAVLAFVPNSAFAKARRPRKVGDIALRAAAQGKGEERLSYGFTRQETRYAPLNQISASNVSRLGSAWSFEVGPGGGGQEATPLVHNGVIFSVTEWSVVFGVDARTGQEKWRWDPEVNQTALRRKICCGVVQRGIALYDGRIIAPAIDGRLIALDEETGKPLWETRVAYCGYRKFHILAAEVAATVPSDYAIQDVPSISGGLVPSGVTVGARPAQ